MLNLDTNILICSLTDQLRSDERNLLEQHEWAISPMVLWEIAKLLQLNRIGLDLDTPKVVRQIGQLEILPIDLRVARASTQLDFNSDPADELIAATSIVYGIPLVTRDRVIRQSKLVPLAM